MANNKSQKITLNLEGPLNMNKNKAEIHNFDTFNEKNSPVYGGCLSPLYKKESDIGNVKTYWDKNGNYWDVKSSGASKYLFKNGIKLNNSPQLGNAFSKTKIGVDKEIIFCSPSHDSNRPVVYFYKEGTKIKVAAPKAPDDALDIYTFNESYSWCFKVIALSGDAAGHEYAFIAWRNGFIRINVISVTNAGTYDSPDISLTQVSTYEKSSSGLNLGEDALRPFINAGTLAKKGGATQAWEQFVDPNTSELQLGISVIPNMGCGVTVRDQNPAVNLVTSTLHPTADADVIIWNRQTWYDEDTSQWSSNFLFDDNGTGLSNGTHIIPTFCLIEIPSGSITGTYQYTPHVTPAYLGDHSNDRIINYGSEKAAQHSFFGFFVFIGGKTISGGVVTFTAAAFWAERDKANGFKPPFPNCLNSFELWPGTYIQCVIVTRDKEMSDNKKSTLDMVRSVDDMDNVKDSDYDGSWIFNMLFKNTSPAQYMIPFTTKAQYPMGYEIAAGYYGDYKNCINGYNGNDALTIATLYGNLLVQTDEIDTEYIPITLTDVNGIVYKSVDGNFYLLKSGEDPYVYNIINDRYVLIKSDTAFNAYDIELDKWHNWTSGFHNNYTIEGLPLSLNAGVGQHDGYKVAETLVYQRGITPISFAVIVASQNNRYTVNSKPFISTQWAPVTVVGRFFERNALPTFMNGEDVQFYFGSTGNEFLGNGTASLEPKYYKSYRYRQGAKPRVYNDNLLTDITFLIEENMLQAPSLLSELIEMYNNKYYISNGSKKFYYLEQYNVSQILGARMLSFVEDIDAYFVIQGMPYVVTKGFIASANLVNGVVQSVDVVTQIRGLQFIGATPKAAYFFSKFSRRISVFTGDIVLSDVIEASNIEVIYRAFYIPAINLLIMSVLENGRYYAYLFPDGNFFRIEMDAPILRCVYSNEDELIITKDNRDIIVDNNCLALRYEPKAGFEKLPIKLSTSYYGLGNENTAVFDCWYIRLYSADRKAAKLKLAANTLTNIGVKSKYKVVEITTQMFDKETGTALVRFQPQFQAATGIQLELECDVPISEISVSYQPDTTQNSSINV